MTIVGSLVESFGDANYAQITKKQTDRGWERVSTNEDWECFWGELEEYDGETVSVRGLDGEHEIETDEEGDYIEVEQEHRGLFSRGEYTTRFRPFLEKRTEDKPWMDDGTEAQNDD